MSELSAAIDNLRIDLDNYEYKEPPKLTVINDYDKQLLEIRKKFNAILDSPNIASSLKMGRAEAIVNRIEKYLSEYDKVMKHLEIKRTFAEKRVNILDCKQYVRNDSTLYYGKPGTGKTYILYAIYLNDWLNGKTGLVINETKFFDNLHYAFKTQYKNRIINFSGSLFYDDLGSKENTSNFVSEFRYSLINERYENGLKTFISANYNELDLRSKVSNQETEQARIMSRLSGLCEFKEVKGKDRRIK